MDPTEWYKWEIWNSLSVSFKATSWLYFGIQRPLVQPSAGCCFMPRHFTPKNTKRAFLHATPLSSTIRYSSTPTLFFFQHYYISPLLHTTYTYLCIQWIANRYTLWVFLLQTTAKITKIPDVKCKPSFKISFSSFVSKMPSYTGKGILSTQL